MRLQLSDEFLHGFETIVDFVVASEPFGCAFGLSLLDAAADGLKGAEGEEHNVVGVVLLHDLRLSAFLFAILSPHNKYWRSREKVLFLTTKNRRKINGLRQSGKPKSA